MDALAVSCMPSGFPGSEKLFQRVSIVCFSHDFPPRSIEGTNHNAGGTYDCMVYPQLGEGD